MYCQLENKMVSIERIGQYTQLPCEAELSIEKTRPASTWPDHGTIVLENLMVRRYSLQPLTRIVYGHVTWAPFHCLQSENFRIPYNLSMDRFIFISFLTLLNMFEKILFGSWHTESKF